MEIYDMTAFAEKMKEAGVDTNAALLYQSAVLHLRNNGYDPRRAVHGLTHEVRADGGILTALMDYGVVRDAALVYLEKIARDMKNAPTVSPQGDGGVQNSTDRRCKDGSPDKSEGDEVPLPSERHSNIGLSPSPQNRNDAVHEVDASRFAIGRVVPIANKPRIDLAALQAAKTLSGPSIFDTIKVRDGRALGELRFGELHAIIGANRREAALLDMIRKYAQPYAQSAKVRDIIKMDDLQRMVQKAAEVSDAE